jgi:hypothetical protein
MPKTSATIRLTDQDAATLRRWTRSSSIRAGLAQRARIVLAAAPDLTQLFATNQPTTARFEGGWTVDTGAKPHTANFYLTKAQVGRPIANVLAAR